MAKVQASSAAVILMVPMALTDTVDLLTVEVMAPTVLTAHTTTVIITATTDFTILGTCCAKRYASLSSPLYLA